MKKVLITLLVLFTAFAVFAAGSSEAKKTETKSEETFTIGMNVDVATYASWRIRSGQEKLALSPVYETLLRWNSEGQIEPFLAESVVADSDKLTYTVTLKDGITFSDGSVLDADVLLWNFENFKANSQTSSTHFGSVDYFEKTGPLTVVIHLKEWNSQIMMSLTTIAGAMYSKKAFDEHGYDWCLEHPVGTGPYVLTEYLTDSYKTYVPNETYWNKNQAATFDKVTIKIVGDNMSAQAALISKELDAYMGGDYQMHNNLEAMGFKLSTNRMAFRIIFLIFGSAIEGSPLTDVRVRQAISYAIDSAAIAKNLDFGKSFVSKEYAVEGTPFFNDNVVGYDYNPEKAKQLLAEAGYPDGFKTKISVGVDQALDRYMIAIQGYLKDVGIDIELDYQETAIWTSKGIYETDEGMILAGHGFGSNLVNQAVNNFSKRAIQGVVMLKNS